MVSDSHSHEKVTILSPSGYGNSTVFRLVFAFSKWDRLAGIDHFFHAGVMHDGRYGNSQKAIVTSYTNRPARQ